MITQGKWEIVDRTPNGSPTIGVSGSIYVADLYNLGREEYEPSPEEAEANAALITAAPELLAACKMLMEALIHVEGDTKGNKVRTAIIPLLKGAASRGRQAIAKAEIN